MAPKSCKNDVKIDAEIEVGQKFEKYKKKVHLGIFSRGHIFNKKRSKTTSKIYLKIYAWKVSKNDAKRLNKLAQMAPKIIEKSIP